MSYAKLLAAAMADPEAADFAELRLAYAARPDFDPYHLALESRQAIEKALGEEPSPAAIEVLDQALAANYVDAEAHMAAALLHEQAGDRAKSDYHKKFARGLILSILESGDGRSPETAFVVIGIWEEYLLLNVLGLSPTRQGLFEHGGSHYDSISVTQGETSQAAELFFNIDRFFGRGSLEA